MGIFGKSNHTSGSSSSTSNTSSWLAPTVEPIINQFINGYDGVDYEDSVVANLTPAEQAALKRAGGGQSIDTGINIAKHGAGLVEQSVAGIQGLLHGGAKTQFMGGVTGLYNSAGGFIANQDAAIQDSVYAEMGNNFGSSAQSTMASTSVAGSSAAQNAQNSILASGANEMTQMMADVSNNVLKGAIGITGGAMRGEIGLMNELMGAGGSIAKAGAHMASSGLKNQFNAGVFEQWFNQQVDNNNRKNDMINGNMDLIDFGVLMQEILPTAGLDTTTTGSSDRSGESHGSGWFGLRG